MADLTGRLLADDADDGGDHGLPLGDASAAPPVRQQGAARGAPPNSPAGSDGGPAQGGAKGAVRLCVILAILLGNFSEALWG